MMKTFLSNEMVEIIREKIDSIKEENNIINPILRNDVFALLESQHCTVLYYPLDDDIEGFRIRKYVNGENEEFVYINTAKPEDVQIFTAAHELGHLLNIDSEVCAAANIAQPNKKMREDIVDRFAAELLMSEEEFKQCFDSKIRSYIDENDCVLSSDMVGTITYLMDYFMVPYVAVVHRLFETKRIGEKVRKFLLDKEKVSSNSIKKSIEDGKYKRLKSTGVKSFGDLAIYLKKLSENGEINERRLKDIMELFDIREFEDTPKVEKIQLEKDVDNEESAERGHN